MPLNAVGPADYKDCRIQYLKGTFHFRRKIHMPRGVQQGDLRPVQVQQRLLGKDRDAPLPFERVGIQKGVPVVHPSEPAGLPRAVEHPLRKGRLARVHVRQNPDYQPFHLIVPIALVSWRDGACPAI